MTKTQLLTELAETLQTTKVIAGQFPDQLTAIAYREAKKKGDRKGRNPAAGESIKIPAKTVVKFGVGKAAKDAVLGAK